MEPPAASTKRHSRNVSYHRALPRRSTKGALDAGDDPLSAREPNQQHSLSSPGGAARDDSSKESQTSTKAGKQQPSKDLSFLLHPEIYHNIPPPFFGQSLPSHGASSTAELLQARNFFGSASVAAEQLTNPSSAQLSSQEIVDLLTTRYLSLIQLGYFHIAGEEAKALGDIHSNFYQDTSTGHRLLPWDFRILVLRLQAAAFADYGRRGIGGCYELAREARAELAQSQSDGSRALWQNRLRSLGILVADLLVEQGDYAGAARYLQSLKRDQSHQSQAAASELEDHNHSENKHTSMDAMLLDIRLALVYMKIGDITAAKDILSQAPLDLPTNSSDESDSTYITTLLSTIRALLPFCTGSYTEAHTALSSLLQHIPNSPSPKEQNLQVTIMNNLGLAQFYTADVSGAVDLLSTPFGEAQTGAITRETVFNLATCYELTSEKHARERKEGLVQDVRKLAAADGNVMEHVSGFGPSDFKV